MKQQLPMPAVISAIAVVLLVVGFLIFQSTQASAGGGTKEQAQLNKVLERTNGDVSKMTPEEKRVYDDGVRKGLFDPTGKSSSSPALGGTRYP